MSLKETLKKWNEPRYKDSDIYNPNSFNPGLFEVNTEMMKKLCPQFFGVGAFFRSFKSKAARYDGINVIMCDGDMNPALVVAEDPYLVACYSGDFDAVVLLAFPKELGEAKGWKIGTELIVTEFYSAPDWWTKKNKDIDIGPYGSTHFKAVCPIVVDLYSDNYERLDRKKAEIPTEMWERTWALAEQYMAKHPGMARNGLDLGYKDAVEISKIVFPPFEL